MAAELDDFEVIENTTYVQADKEDYPGLEAEVSVYGSVMAVSVSVGVVASACVIWLLRYTAKYRVTSMYVVNRCIADLLFLLGGLAFVIQFGVRNWILGEVVCRLTMAAVHVCAYASNAFLVIMSVDCFYIVNINDRDNSAYRARLFKILTIAVWSATFILAIPFIILFGTIKPEDSSITHCILLYPIRAVREASIWSYLLSTVPTLVVSWIMLYLVYFSSRSSALALENDSEGYAAKRLLLSFTVSFTICQLPHLLPKVIQSIMVTFNVLLWRIAFFTSVLIFVNAAASPVVYLVMRKRMTTCQRNPDHPTNSLLPDRQEVLTDEDL